MAKKKEPKMSECYSEKTMKMKALFMVLLGVLALGWSLDYIAAKMVALIIGAILVIKGIYNFLNA